jgi:cobalt-zinc-cadmium efflux system protein
MSPQMPDTHGMLWLAILGIAVNGFAAFRMMGTKSLNERMVYLHLLEDVMGWVAVLIGSIVMMWKPWPIIDPVMAIAISLWVLWNAIGNLRQTVQIFLQGSPMQFQVVEVQEAIRQQQYVQGVHHTHIWSLDGEHHILTTHLQVDAAANLDRVHELKTAIKKMLFEKFHIQEATIEIEWPHQVCVDPKH